MERFAIISDCGKYRYLLERIWNARAKRRVLFIMLNPSTADAEIDDPTIRSCIRLSKAYGRLEVCNLFAFRSTNPDVLDGSDRMIGPLNDAVIACAIRRCSHVICAWGAHSAAEIRAEYMVDTIKAAGRKPYCFGLTKKGAPKHPLYVKTGTPLEIYRGI